MRPRWLVPVLLLLAVPLFAGCFVYSLNPLCAPEDMTFDPELLGSWRNSDQGIALDISRDGAGPGYVFDYREGGEEESKRYAVMLTCIDGGLYMDVTLSDDDATQDESPANDTDESSDAPEIVHIPLKACLDGDYFTYALMDPDWLREYIAAHPAEIAHDTSGDDPPPITAATPELRRFIATHGDEAGVFTDEVTLTRIR